MNSISKLSEMTYKDIATYIRLDEISEDDQKTLEALMAVAKSYIVQYTGLTEEQLDDYPDFIVVMFVLCQDMWDNRAMYVDKTNLNNVVQSILNMHAVNLL